MKKRHLAICCFALLHAAGSPAGELFSSSFARGDWNANDWILVKSPRWDHFGGWVQRDTHIENETPKDAAPKDLIGKRAHETYTSMVLKRKLKGNVTVASTVEFADRMAPLVVIAPELGKDAKGRPEYREHFEIVLFDKGINVWHHFFEDGEPSWKKAAYCRIPFEPNTKHELKVRIRKTSKGRMLSVSVGEHEMGYMDDSLPDEFHVGITGCEGVNRFYSFSVSK